MRLRQCQGPFSYFQRPAHVREPQPCGFNTNHFPCGSPILSPPSTPAPLEAKHSLQNWILLNICLLCFFWRPWVLVVAHGVFIAHASSKLRQACGVKFPSQGWNPGFLN